VREPYGLASLVCLILLGSCDIVRSLLKQLSLSLRYLVSLDIVLWYRDNIVTLLIPVTTQEAVTFGLSLVVLSLAGRVQHTTGQYCIGHYKMSSISRGG